MVTIVGIMVVVMVTIYFGSGHLPEPLLECLNKKCYLQINIVYPRKV